MHFIVFFIPFILSYLIKDPISSYLVSWGGSVFLIVYSIYIDKKINDEKLKFFKPLVLSQCLFWVYTAVTSVFYFLDQLGYDFFEKVDYANMDVIQGLSKTQSYIVFAHGAYLAGYFIYKNREKTQEYEVFIQPEDYLKLSIGATILALGILFTPFAQLSNYLNVFSTICAVKYFGYSLSYRRLAFKGFLYFAGILLLGFLSGMKENTLFPLIYLGIILYDKYGIPRTTAVFLPLIFAYFYFIPTINFAVRSAAWYGNKGAVETITSLNDLNLLDEKKIKSNNWEFLCTRLSEISMLNIYIESVPKYRPYYGFEIYKYGFMSLVPRFLWPGKQSPDVTAQKRAIDNGALILNTSADTTSAKPQTIADAYMSYGYISILITFLVYGFLVHYFAALLERKLGYDLGLSILYYSLFGVLTKGGCFENLFNTTFFGFILIFVTLQVLKQFNLINKIN
ncbi:MAG: hypothetical protein EOO90_05950 [Pedobacter sp.]|nr:MAG: hypothetical protein EOO90_05950 [Pedobacter sp.]